MHAVLYDRQGYIKWGGRSEPSPQNAQLPPQNDDIITLVQVHDVQYVTRSTVMH